MILFAENGHFLNSQGQDIYGILEVPQMMMNYQITISKVCILVIFNLEYK
jgi:hypothetical protein